MAPKKYKTKKRLTAHTLLMIFTLFTLGCSVVAWFVNVQKAEISTLQMQVDKKELVQMNQVTDIRFYTSTNIADTTDTLFNAEYTGCVVKTYELQGAVDVVTAVACTGEGMLAYVCYDDDTTDYYSEIHEKLVAKLGNDKSQWTFDKIRSALKEVNKHKVTTRNSSGNTTVKIVYWVEYDEAETLLNSALYWTSSDDQYKANITFTA